MDGNGQVHEKAVSIQVESGADAVLISYFADARLLGSSAAFT